MMHETLGYEELIHPLAKYTLLSDCDVAWPCITISWGNPEFIPR